MSSKTDTEYGGKGAPPKKPKVKGGYRKRYRDLIRENKRADTIRPARVTFSGLAEDLKGHIYDVITGPQADQFTATTKDLARYSGRKCSNYQDIRIVIEHKKDVVIPIPTSRMDIDMVVMKLFLGKDIDVYIKRSQQYHQNKEKCTLWPWDNARRS